MDNLDYLKEMKKYNSDTLNVNAQCRTAKALEIIAEHLIKIDANISVLTSVIEAVTNQGKCVNVSGRVEVI